MSLFVDTTVWYAASDSGESRNGQAKQILNNGEPLVTSDHVLTETWLLLNSRISSHAANQFWRALRAGVATVESITPADLEAAWHIGEAYPDQDFSIVDRTSFAVMRRLGIERAASFDHHFAIFRFGPERRRAFTILH